MNISEGMIGNRNYENGKIYKLVNDINDNFYVGSTVNSLAKRKYWHRTKGSMMPGVKAIYDEIGWDQLKIVLVENFPCDSNDELRQRERFWYDELKPDLNRQRPWVGVEEAKQETKQRNEQYQQDNVDKIKQQQKEYREANVDKIKQYQKQYQQDNKQQKMEYDAQYRKSNPDKIKQYKKQYYDKIKQQKKQSIECVCGVTIRNYCLPKHQQTPKHIRFQKIYDFIAM